MVTRVLLDTRGGNSAESSRRDTLSRRDMLKWVGAAAATPYVAACSEETFALRSDAEPAGARPWPDVEMVPADGRGYTQDPDFFADAQANWPRLLSPFERKMFARMADLILPATDSAPAPSEIGVADFFDEWLSAPYAPQQADRQLLVPGAHWFSREIYHRTRRSSGKAPDAAFLKLFDILDRPAAPATPTPPTLSADQKDPVVGSDAAAGNSAKGERFDPAPVVPQARRFFGRFRALTLGAYYTHPAGMADLGHVENVATPGLYPGPSEAAMSHLRAQLDALSLTIPGDMA